MYAVTVSFSADAYKSENKKTPENQILRRSGRIGMQVLMSASATLKVKNLN